MSKNAKFELLYSLTFESSNLCIETESCVLLQSKHLNSEKPERYMSDFLLAHNRKLKNKKSFCLDINLSGVLVFIWMFGFHLNILMLF